jgi:hypothetical protein
MMANFMKRLALLCFSLCLTASATIAATPEAPSLPRPNARAPQNVDISQSRGNESETALAISHTNPMLMTSVSNLESSAMSHSWSTDGGKTWQHDTIADGDALGFACCDGQLAADDFGNIFLAYLNSAIEVKIGISTDGGATFQPLPFLSSLPSGVPSFPLKSLARAGERISGDQPSIACGPGSVWLSWTSSGGTIQASGAPVTGLGQVGIFSPAQGVAGANRSGDYGDTSVGPDGQVFIVYQSPTGGEGPATIFGALDPDGLGPQGFGSAQTLQTTNVGGFDYIPAQSGRSIDAEAGLAWDRTGGLHNGRLYFIYVSEEPAESDNTDIQLRFSDDNGATWSAPRRINDDTGTSSQFNPRIALDGSTGNFAIAWYDTRNDHADHQRGDTNGRPNDDTILYYTLSRDGGNTFRRNSRISAGPSNDDNAQSQVDYGDYSGFSFYGGILCFSGADNSNVTGDNPDGTLSHFDLYAAPVTVR